MLDAARGAILAYGVRRTTLTDVARRAGVSRMTLYRRWPDVQTMVADLMTREWLATVDACRPPASFRGSARDRLVAHITAAVRALRAHPLLVKILEADPELLLPYLLDRRGSSQDAMLAVLAEQLRAGQRDRSVRRGDPVRLGRAVLLTAQSFLLSAPTMAAGRQLAALDRELGELLDRYLRP